MLLQGFKKLSSRFYNNREYLSKTISLAWPTVIDSFLVAFVGIINTFMVSSIGTKAVAAVGLTLNPRFLGLAVFMSLDVSASVLAARRKGEEDRTAANLILLQILIITLLLGIVVSALCVCFADQIIRLMGSNEEIHEGAVNYFRFTMGYLLIHVLSLAINAAQRGVGNVKIALKTNIAANLFNLCGGFFLIEGRLGFPALGIRGAAVSAVLGTMVSLIMSIASILRKDSYLSLHYILQHHLVPRWNNLLGILKISIPILSEQLCMRVGFILVAFMVAKLGTDAIAANQLAMNVMGLSYSLGDGLAIATVALMGESLGKGDIQLAERCVKICSYFGNSISVVLSVIYLIFGKGIYMIFFQEEAVIHYGVQIMSMMVLIVPLQLIQLVYMGSLRGAGDTIFTAIATLLCVTIIRPLFGFIFCNVVGVGLIGIWMGILLDQIVRVFLTSYRYKTDKWKHIRI